MTQYSFFKEVIGLYREARKNTYPSKNITRGRSHSISSNIEDFFAYYLRDKIPFEHIYIDQSITFPKKLQVYPDLIVVKRSKARHFIDLKTDMGWKRDSLARDVRKKYRLLQKIAGKNGTIKIGVPKEKKILKIDRSVTYDVVILSSKNIKKKLLDKQIKKVQELNAKVGVYVLCLGHANRNHDMSIEDAYRVLRPDIQPKAFTSLVKRLGS